MNGPTRPADAIREGARFLAARGIESARENAEALLRHVLHTDRAGLYSRRDGLSEAEASAFGRTLSQRASGVPLQYITGEQQFMSLSIATEPGVFVPRPETEVLVEAALESIERRADPLIVDVGTGTGAVALALKSARPDARVLATDVSVVAVTLARKNAGRLGLEVEVLHGSGLAPAPADVQGSVSLVVSNPPYVSREDYDALPGEVKAEPYEALVGGTELHAELARHATSWLAPGGWIVVEIGAEQGRRVRELLERAGLSSVEILPDMAGRDRVVRGQVAEP